MYYHRLCATASMTSFKLQTDCRFIVVLPPKLLWKWKIGCKWSHLWNNQIKGNDAATSLHTVAMILINSWKCSVPAIQVDFPLASTSHLDSDQPKPQSAQAGATPLLLSRAVSHVRYSTHMQNLLSRSHTGHSPRSLPSLICFGSTRHYLALSGFNVTAFSVCTITKLLFSASCFPC